MVTPNPPPDFKGLGFSKVGHFKEVRAKIKELENLNLELARRHNKLEAILNSLSDGLTILNRELDIVFANQVQKALFNKSNLEGQKCYRAFFHRDQPCRNCPALATISQQKSFRGEFQLKEGELIRCFCEWTTLPLRSQSGQVEEVVLLMRDITDRKRWEMQLMQTHRMAAVGLLADSIAHAINNPLTSIAGFSEALLNRLAKNNGGFEAKQLKTMAEYLAIINSEAYRCKDIIRQLQDFSRTSSEQNAILNVDQILRSTVNLLRQHARNQDIKIVFKSNLAASLNSMVGNESQLKHVFFNLINFMFQQLPGGGELSLSTRNVGNLIEISLQCVSGGFLPAAGDTGGLEQQAASQSLSTTMSIDLSICESIIQQYHGTLQIDSTRKAVLIRFPAATIQKGATT